MTSSITRKICLWLAFLEHWGNVKKGVINGKASFTEFSIDADWHAVFLKIVISEKNL